jgi:hypothetical protein
MATVNPQTGGTLVEVVGGGLDSSPDTLAQPIPLNALQTWQRYEFPAGSNITYIVAQNTHPTETMMVYLDAESTGARDTICGTNGAPPVNNVPVPGLFYVPPLSAIVQPLQEALSKGTYLGGVIDCRLKNSAAAACDNLITAG